jgi:hypothetical protein
MTTETSTHENEDMAKQRRLRLLWFSPWALILGFVMWHFCSTQLRYIAARLSWDIHRHRLATAYVAKNDSPATSDLFPVVPDPHYFEMLNTLDLMKSDLKRLNGSDDEWSKRRYIEDADQCVQEAAQVFPKPVPKAGCISLIVNNRPYR